MCGAEFSGYYTHNIDPKGRVTIPSAYREALGENFTIGLNNEFNAVALYPQEKWESIGEMLDRIPDSDQRGRAYVRLIKAFSFPGQKLDQQGRILLPQGAPKSGDGQGDPLCGRRKVFGDLGRESLCRHDRCERAGYRELACLRQRSRTTARIPDPLLRAEPGKARRRNCGTKRNNMESEGIDMRTRRKHRFTRAMRLILVGMLFAGLFLQIGMLSRISGKSKEIAKVSQEIVDLDARSENLQWALSQLQNPEKISARAQEMGMVHPEADAIRVVKLPASDSEALTQTADMSGGEGLVQ